MDIEYARHPQSGASIPVKCRHDSIAKIVASALAVTIFGLWFASYSVAYLILFIEAWNAEPTSFPSINEMRLDGLHTMLKIGGAGLIALIILGAEARPRLRRARAAARARHAPIDEEEARKLGELIERMRALRIPVPTEVETLLQRVDTSAQLTHDELSAIAKAINKEL